MIRKCDELFSEIRKAEAKYICEYSGKEQTRDSDGKITSDIVLCVHHIAGKKNLAMRYAKENTVVITTGIHNFVAHREDRKTEFRQWAMKHTGLTDAMIHRFEGDLYANQIRTYYAIIRDQYVAMYAAGLIQKKISLPKDEQ